ncbi:MAG: hypothetical protein JJU36_07695 [Phycisphaeraceae bacterium]|nr:hypothetical protein [Phycisphaeraceae bacterium]
MSSPRPSRPGQPANDSGSNPGDGSESRSLPLPDVETLPRPDLPPEDRPPAPIPMSDAEKVIAILRHAAHLNSTLPARTGSLVELGEQGQVILTGDLHDHTPNLDKIIHFAALHRHPDRVLILHEVIHGPFPINGCDLSARTLIRIAAMQLQYPGRVLNVMSNHELAQYRGEGILKDAGEVTALFDRGLERLFGNDAQDVRAAIGTYIVSLPLAVRMPRGILFSHSLPSPRVLNSFDPAILQRTITPNDLEQAGDAYRMVWGRRHTERTVETLGKAWNVELFITGHQPADMGYEIQADRVLILASDHDHGMILPLRLDRAYTIDQAVEELIPLNGILVDQP